MAVQDKVNLMQDIEGTLKSRMFANLLEEAVTEINDHLDNYDVVKNVPTDNGADDLMDCFVKAKKVEGRSENTLGRYVYEIGRLMKFSNVSTRDINTYHIRDYFDMEKKRGISESTIEGQREVFGSFFRWLTDERLIRANPVHNLGTIKVPKRVKEAITDSDMERMRRGCTNLRDSALLNMLRSTGCRVSEISGLNRDDVDMENNECTVIGKGNKERTVYIDDVTAMILKEYLITRSDDNEALFINHAGSRLLPGGIRNILNKIADSVGVEHIHPHKFRRTLITNMLNRGMPIQEVAILAGHDKVDTTMGYFAVNKSQIKNSYSRFTR